MADTIRIAIADDHPIVRQGLRVALGAQDDLELVGEASNGAEAVELAKSLDPDVMIMDLQMPVMDGITAIQEITDENERRVHLGAHELPGRQERIQCHQGRCNGILTEGGPLPRSC